MSDCIFCKIISGDLPSFKVWEDENHIAFLTIFPNTPGFTVMASKKHLPSYFAENSDKDLVDFIKACKTVARLIDGGFDDVGRTGMMFEGFGVDHLHAKFFPMHGTVSDTWQAHNSDLDKYFDYYEGYISSHNGPRADDSELSGIAAKIRGN